MVAGFPESTLSRSLVRVPGSGREPGKASSLIDFSRVSTAAASVPVPNDLPPALSPGHRALQDLPQQRPVDKKIEVTEVPVLGIRCDPSSPSLRPPSRGRAPQRVVMNSTASFHQKNRKTFLVKGPEVSMERGIQETRSSQTAPSRKRPRSPEPSRDRSMGNMNVQQASIGIQGCSLEFPGTLTESMPVGLAASLTTLAGTVPAGATSGILLGQAMNVPQPATTPSTTTTTTTAAAFPAVFQGAQLHLLQERKKLRADNEALKQRVVLFQELFRNKALLTRVIRRLGVQV